MFTITSNTVLIDLVWFEFDNSFALRHSLMLNEAYRRMFDALGPQDWWPADSRLEVIVGAVLTQNTNWRNVELAIENLRRKDLLSLEKLRDLELEQLADLIRPSGYYRLKAKRLKNVIELIAERFGDVETMRSQPLTDLREELLEVNGVGAETADSILLYGLEMPTFVVDAYAARIAKRHGWVDPDTDYAGLKDFFESQLKSDTSFFNEYHALIVQVGKNYCRSKPNCEGCPLEPMLPKTGFVDL